MTNLQLKALIMTQLLTGPRNPIKSLEELKFDAEVIMKAAEVEK